jgi:hypothetical protein
VEGNWSSYAGYSTEHIKHPLSMDGRIPRGWHEDMHSPQAYFFELTGETELHQKTTSGPISGASGNKCLTQLAVGHSFLHAKRLEFPGKVTRSLLVSDATNGMS